MGSTKPLGLKPIGLILAGGESKRLFPTSLPKPLLEVRGKLLIEEALDRLKGFDIWIVTNREIAQKIRAALKKRKRALPKFAIEPEPRDTAAAVGFGLKTANPKALDRWVAVLSADQWMPGCKSFSSFLKTVSGEIKKFPDSLFVAGSPAESKTEASHSQFGWILCDRKNGGVGSYRVQKFIEKPQAEMLLQMRADGGLINAGMFFGRWQTFMEAYQAHYPDVLKKAPYRKLERQPIDRAIFEKFKSVRALLQPFAWEDLGTWEDWFQLVDQGMAHRVACDRVFVRSQKLEVYAFGLKNISIIEFAGKLLVMPLSETRNLKKFLEQL